MANESHKAGFDHLCTAIIGCDLVTAKRLINNPNIVYYGAPVEHDAYGVPVKRCAPNLHRSYYELRRAIAKGQIDISNGSDTTQGIFYALVPIVLKFAASSGNLELLSRILEAIDDN